jgi:hypothetical protein
MAACNNTNDNVACTTPFCHFFYPVHCIDAKINSAEFDGTSTSVSLCGQLADQTVATDVTTIQSSASGYCNARFQWLHCSVPHDDCFWFWFAKTNAGNEIRWSEFAAGGIKFKFS